MTVVELLVLVRDLELAQAAREELRPVVEVPLVPGAAVEEQEPERAQPLGVPLEHAQRVELEPALPDGVAERPGLEVAGEVDPERPRSRAGRIRRRHPEDVEGDEVLVTLLALGLELLEPGREPAGLLHLGAELGHVAAIAVVEVEIAAVARHRREHPGVFHAEGQGSVSARRLAEHAAVLAPRERAVPALHPRHQLLDQVILVAPGRARVQVLGAAEARKAVGHDEDHLATRPALDQRVHAVVEGRGPGVVVQEHPPAAGEAGEHEGDRVAGGGRVVVGRGQVDRHGALRRVSRRIAAQDGALEALQHHSTAFHARDCTDSAAAP